MLVATSYLVNLNFSRFLLVTASSAPLLAFQGLQTDMCHLYETWQRNLSPAIDDLMGGHHHKPCSVTQKLALPMHPATLLFDSRPPCTKLHLCHFKMTLLVIDLPQYAISFQLLFEMYLMSM